MSFTNRFRTIFLEKNREFLEHFSFDVSFTPQRTINLLSEKCVILIEFERHSYQYSIVIRDPSQKANMIDYQFLMIISDRCHDYWVKASHVFESLQVDDGDPAYILESVPFIFGIMKTYCVDILGGDFSFSSRYMELDMRFKKYAPTIINMNHDSDLSKKFWRGDYSWLHEVADLPISRGNTK